MRAFARPSTLYVAGAVCGAMCLIPGLPGFTFLLVAGGLIWTGRSIGKGLLTASVPDEGTAEKQKKAEQGPSGAICSSRSARSSNPANRASMNRGHSASDRSSAKSGSTTSDRADSQSRSSVAGRQLNHPTTARIPGGALVERAAGIEVKQMGTISLILNDADFHTAEKMAGAVNEAMGKARARAIDSRRVEVVPEEDEDVASLIDRVEEVEVEVFPRARVVVNERTGTVVIGGTVRLLPISILQGGLSVNVQSEIQVSQPGPFSNGTTQTVEQSRVDAQDKPVNRITLKQGATVEDLVQELQQIGAGAREVIAILQAMKEAGALEADLEVL